VNALTGPLPADGLLCVEASAGTGKTHLLSTLAARFVVEREDVRIADVLVVTYTVAAAAELRGRVRARLADVRDRLASGVTGGDAYLEHLASLPAPDTARRRADRALAEFDTATISTIHAFAAAWLGEGGVTVGPSEERRRQAVADVLAGAAFDATTPLFDASFKDDEFDREVRLALDNPDLVLTPLDGAVASPAALAHRDAVRRAMAVFDERGRRDGVRTYANLLTELDAAIAEDDAPVLRALRNRYRVGLIDEFQDTDPTQWRLFRRLFLDAPGRALVVVGDPKQAIYGFRGADVDTYLDARQAADDTAGRGLGVDELTVNYRSDGVLLEGLNGLLRGAYLDEDERIAYVPVEAAPDHRVRRLRWRDGADAAPLALRVAVGTGPISLRRRAIAEECADEAVRALGAHVVDADGTARALTEDDVVVLCESSTQFPLLREAFLRRGLRTTETRSDDVVRTAAALDVAIALRALRDPGDAGAVAAMSHAWFGTREEDGVGGARARLAAWRVALDARGVVALGRAMTDARATPGLLCRRFGERALTDVQHLVDVLAATAGADAGPTALLEALEALVEATREASDDDVRSRRIDTDAPAVRLMSVHGAKGLEYDVVLCPFVQRTTPDDRGPTVWREAALGTRLLDAGGREKWTDPSLAAATPEARLALAASAAGGERRRLLYVALTRARHRTVVWWLRAHGDAEMRRDELTGLLLDRDDDHEPVHRPRAARGDAAGYLVDGDGALTAMHEHLAPLVSSGVLELDAVGGARAEAPARTALAAVGLADGSDLAVARLDRALVERAQRCSFSSLVAPLHAGATTLDEGVGDGRADDEGAEVDAAEPDTVAGAAAPADGLGGLRGTAFGSAVHEALEAGLRRRAGTFEEAVTASLADALRRHGLPFDEDAASGLLRAAAVPLGDGPALRDLRPTDVATELRFALPVAERVDLAAVARTVATHDRDGPFAAWADALAATGRGRTLAASLVGSIDLVTTFGGDRHHVVDYKTNVVASAAGYGADGLLTSMRASEYPLQAALYLVALHRLLRWRRPGYDPDRDLGGAHYLYLRGLSEGSGRGVCTWTPSAATVVALSDLFAGRG
jgi:exodeoxyribonuclease V beta subunit